MSSRELQIGRYGLTHIEIYNELLSHDNKQAYTLHLVQKAQNHMKVSELFETWETLNVLEYLNSPRFDIDMREYLTLMPNLCYTCPVKDLEAIKPLILD